MLSPPTFTSLMAENCHKPPSTANPNSVTLCCSRSTNACQSFTRAVSLSFHYFEDFSRRVTSTLFPISQGPPRHVIAAGAKEPYFNVTALIFETSFPFILGFRNFSGTGVPPEEKTKGGLVLGTRDGGN